MTGKASKKSNVVTSDSFIEIRDKAIEKEYGLKPKNLNQERYMNAIENNTLVFGVGPAGTGKTYVATGMAARDLRSESSVRDKIIIFRPNVETGQKLGHLPGDLNEKIEPYNEGILDTLKDHLGHEVFNAMVEAGKIQSKALGFQRGKSYDRCWVVLDEAQNADPITMKMFLTRIGSDCKMLVNGDMDQTDLKGPSGLVDAIDKLKGMDDMGIVEFTEDDCVRSEIVKDILKRYRN